MKPSVGRIVHYTPKPEEGIGAGPLAALVTMVAPEQAVLTVFLVEPVKQADGRLTATAWVPVVAEAADTPTPGRWHWPPHDAD